MSLIHSRNFLKLFELFTIQIKEFPSQEEGMFQSWRKQLHNRDRKRREEGRKDREDEWRKSGEMLILLALSLLKKFNLWLIPPHRENARLKQLHP